jgi:hypothetical protein
MTARKSGRSEKRETPAETGVTAGAMEGSIAVEQPIINTIVSPRTIETRAETGVREGIGDEITYLLMRQEGLSKECHVSNRLVYGFKRRAVDYFFDVEVLA